jgi:hypothetical protein
MIAWWTDQTAGLIGAVAGSSTGLLGGLVGTIAGIFGPRGKFKRLVFGLAWFMIIGGAISLVAGLFALVAHQPYAVWYPLVLLGGVNVVLLSALMPVIARGYRQADARRLEAEELRRS